MGIQKLAFNFMVERGGKLAKSLLCSKPKPILNFENIRYKPLFEKIKFKKAKTYEEAGIFAKDVVAPTPSTPRTTVEEPPISPTPSGSTPKVTPKAEVVVESEPIVNKPVVEPVVEKPAMTMTDEAKANNNNIKSLLENPISDKVENWRDPKGHVTPFAQEGKTMVSRHHNFYGSNAYYNSSLDKMLQPYEHFKYTNPERYNRIVRNLTDSFRKLTTELLDENIAFTKITPQPNNCVVYRGTCRSIGYNRQDFDIINSAKIGDEIIPTRGFAYAAHHKFGAYQYLENAYDLKGNIVAEPMLIEYRIPKGAQVSSNMEHGGEVVFPALSKFKLLSKETRLIETFDVMGKVNGSQPYRHIVLEYIPEIPLP